MLWQYHGQVYMHVNFYNNSYIWSHTLPNELRIFTSVLIFIFWASDNISKFNGLLVKPWNTVWLFPNKLLSHQKWFWKILKKEIAAEINCKKILIYKHRHKNIWKSNQIFRSTWEYFFNFHQIMVENYGNSNW